jgi:hypothetical protein
MLCPRERASHELPTGIEGGAHAIEPEEVALQRGARCAAACAALHDAFVCEDAVQGSLAKGVTGERRLDNKERKK